MKQITEKSWRYLPNAWGQYSHSAEQVFMVEDSDVGKRHDNYLGQGHASHVFTHGDVGRKVDVYTDRGKWTCWCWDSRERAA